MMAINCQDEMKIEYHKTVNNVFNTDIAEPLSIEGTQFLSGTFSDYHFYIGDNLNASFLLSLRDGLTTKTVNGTYSLLHLNSEDRQSISAHEVLGHGLSILKGLPNEQNNLNAVRMDNLVRRILHKSSYHSIHDDYEYINNNNPHELPQY